MRFFDLFLFYLFKFITGQYIWLFTKLISLSQFPQASLKLYW